MAGHTRKMEGDENQRRRQQTYVDERDKDDGDHESGERINDQRETGIDHHVQLTDIIRRPSHEITH